MVPFLNDPNTNSWDGPDGALSMIGVGLNKEDPLQQTYSYRTKEWRYIRYLDGREELYNHVDDPYEWHNLADSEAYQDRKEDLIEQMAELIER